MSKTGKVLNKRTDVLMGSMDTRLFELISAGDVPSLRRLFEEDPRLLGTCDKEGCSPLAAAVDDSRPEVVRLLLELSANPGETYSIGDPMPLLAHACYAGCDEDMPRPELERDLAVVRALLDGGAPVDARDGPGMTPLIFAAMSNKLRLARLLLEYGADVDAASNAEETPLSYCCVWGYADFARLLIDHGANVLWTDGHGNSLLDFAEDGSVRQIVEAAVRRMRHGT